MNYILQKCILFTLFLFIMTSCANSDDDNRIATRENNSSITKISHTSNIDQSITNQIKDRVIKRDEVTNVRGINIDQEVLLAIKVTQLNQFNEQDIEKKIKKWLEKDYTNLTIDISSDQKIFMELDKMERLIQDNKISKDKLNKKYYEVKKLLNEQA